MGTRKLVAGIVVPIVLALGIATPALADTTGGGGDADLGLDAIAITSTHVNGKTGIATVNGTIDCSQDVSVFVGAEIDQVVGRFNTLRGWGGDAVDCSAADGSAAWTVVVQPEQGKFANGRATLSAFAEVDICTDEGCIGDFVSVGPETIRLGK
ncbi:MAG TPA: hypothetical protein VIK65_08865 [Candidatus Limnocylindrales bacterium]|jgi:hypothetical protein